ncbi:MAG: hypothetical protein VX278_04250, partial [Myxococcota bacterium]|nr:hypothetical protein [Myxococcota bacterium]
SVVCLLLPCLQYYFTKKHDKIVEERKVLDITKTTHWEPLSWTDIPIPNWNPLLEKHKRTILGSICDPKQHTTTFLISVASPSLASLYIEKLRHRFLQSSSTTFLVKSKGPMQKSGDYKGIEDIFPSSLEERIFALIEEEDADELTTHYIRESKKGFYREWKQGTPMLLFIDRYNNLDALSRKVLQELIDWTVQNEGRSQLYIIGTVGFEKDNPPPKSHMIKPWIDELEWQHLKEICLKHPSLSSNIIRWIEEEKQSHTEEKNQDPSLDKICRWLTHLCRYERKSLRVEKNQLDFLPGHRKKIRTPDRQERKKRDYEAHIKRYVENKTTKIELQKILLYEFFRSNQPTPFQLHTLSLEEHITRSPSKNQNAFLIREDLLHYSLRRILEREAQFQKDDQRSSSKWLQNIPHNIIRLFKNRYHTTNNTHRKSDTTRDAEREEIYVQLLANQWSRDVANHILSFIRNRYYATLQNSADHTLNPKAKSGIPGYVQQNICLFAHIYACIGWGDRETESNECQELEALTLYAIKFHLVTVLNETLLPLLKLCGRDTLELRARALLIPRPTEKQTTLSLLTEFSHLIHQSPIVPNQWDACIEYKTWLHFFERLYSMKKEPLHAQEKEMLAQLREKSHLSEMNHPNDDSPLNDPYHPVYYQLQIQFYYILLTSSPSDQSDPNQLHAFVKKLEQMRVEIASKRNQLASSEAEKCKHIDFNLKLVDLRVENQYLRKRFEMIEEISKGKGNLNFLGKTNRKYESDQLIVEIAGLQKLRKAHDKNNMDYEYSLLRDLYLHLKQYTEAYDNNEANIRVCESKAQKAKVTNRYTYHAQLRNIFKGACKQVFALLHMSPSERNDPIPTSKNIGSRLSIATRKIQEIA